MSINIKSGTASDFFKSAMETAREIDEGKKITKKSIIWIDPADLISLLKPERRKLVKFLRGKDRIAFQKLMLEMRRNAGSLNRDLDLLSRYDLVKTYKEKKPGRGIHKIVEPLYGNQLIEFKVEI